MRCHSVLSVEIGEVALDLAGTGKVFEVHPTYGFRSLLRVSQHSAPPTFRFQPGPRWFAGRSMMKVLRSGGCWRERHGEAEA
jgi:hypothetical protein